MFGLVLADFVEDTSRGRRSSGTPAYHQGLLPTGPWRAVPGVYRPGPASTPCPSNPYHRTWFAVVLTWFNVELERRKLMLLEYVARLVCFSLVYTNLF